MKKSKYRSIFVKKTQNHADKGLIVGYRSIIPAYDARHEKLYIGHRMAINHNRYQAIRPVPQDIYQVNRTFRAVFYCVYKDCSPSFFIAFPGLVAGLFTGNRQPEMTLGRAMNIRGWHKS
jgi:hypothetical protein